MKDMLSNDLAVGDCVMVKYGNEWLSAVILKMQNGGLSVGVGNLTQKNPQTQVTADVLVLQVTMPLAGHPGQPQPFVARLDVKNKVAELVESSVKM
jgi:hypothetical protein